MTARPHFAPLPEDWHRALAVVAHPDDLEYGAASAIARWTSQGKHVCYLLVTRGEAGIEALTPAEVAPLREQDERQSARAVGVECVDFLNYRDGVIPYDMALRRDIARVIRQQRPEIVITLPYQVLWVGQTLNMADHRWVALAVLDAARDAGNRWIFPELLAEGLEPWNGVRMVWLNESPDAAHAVDVSAFLTQGIASLAAQQTYLAHLSTPIDPGAFLRQHAEAVGRQFGCQYAVAFEVVRI